MKIQFLKYISEHRVQTTDAIVEIDSFKDIKNINEILNKNGVNQIHVYDINQNDMFLSEPVEVALDGMNIPEIIFHIDKNTPKIKINILNSRLKRIRIKSYCNDLGNLKDSNLVSINICNSSLYEISSRKTSLSLVVTDSFISNLNLTECKIFNFMALTSYFKYFRLDSNHIVYFMSSHSNLECSNFLNNFFADINVVSCNLEDSRHINNVVAVGDYEDKFKKCHCFNNQCPKEGTFIAWKKCKYREDKWNTNSCLVKLLIPEDAKRSSGTSNKCRCDKALVLEITTIPKNQDVKPTIIDEAFSWYDSNFLYKTGETVEVTDFDDDNFKTCGAGIHFFMDKQSAIDYDI